MEIFLFTDNLVIENVIYKRDVKNQFTDRNNSQVASGTDERVFDPVCGSYCSN